jgi:hypothetical protein
MERSVNHTQFDMVFQTGPKQFFSFGKGKGLMMKPETLPNIIRRHLGKGEKKKQRGKDQSLGKQQPKRGGPHKGKGTTKY